MRQRVRNDIAPQIGPRGVAVQEDDGLACADVHVAHVGVEDGNSLAWMRVAILRKIVGGKQRHVGGSLSAS